MKKLLTLLLSLLLVLNSSMIVLADEEEIAIEEETVSEPIDDLDITDEPVIDDASEETVLSFSEKTVYEDERDEEFLDDSFVAGATFMSEDRDLFELTPVAAMTPEDETKYWASLDKTAADINIPEGITSVPDEAFVECNTLKTIVFPHSLRIIGESAFNNCLNLESVTFNEGITDIGAYAFYWCEKLTELTLPNSLQTIGEDAFYRNTFIDDGPTRINVSSIEKMLSIDCPMSFPHYRLFVDGEEISDLLIPESVTTIGEGALSNCDSLTSLTIPGSLKHIGNRCFEYCDNLAWVIIEDGVESIGEYSLSDNASMKTVSLPPTLKSCGKGSFMSLSGLERIDVPSAEAWLNISFSGYYSCPNAYGELYIAGQPVTSASELLSEDATSIPDYLFSNCRHLTNIDIPSTVTSIGQRAFYNCVELKEATIPRSVNKIGYQAFQNCTSLKAVNIPGGVTEIASETFAGCSSLQNLSMSYGLTTIGYGAFRDCKALDSVFVPSTVTTIGNRAFYNCANLNYITLPSALKKIDYYAFQYCRNLSSITLPAGLETLGGYAFSDCSSLMSVAIPDSVTVLNDSTFENCTSLATVVLPSLLTKIGSRVFARCTDLKNIDLPSSLTSLGDSAFNYCGKLEKIVIPNGVATLNTSLFANCTNLKSVTIPASVTEIKDKVFSSCTSLQKIYVPKTVTTIAASYYSYSPFYGCDPNLVISTDAASKLTGWGNSWNSCSSSTALTVKYNQSLSTFNSHGSHRVCGDISNCSHGFSAVSFTAITGNYFSGNSYRVYLNGDKTFDEIEIDNGAKVYLCLNGHSLNTDIYVEEGCQLTICDCVGGGDFSGNIYNLGTTNIYGGTFRYPGSIGNSRDLSIYGGSFYVSIYSSNGTSDPTGPVMNISGGVFRTPENRYFDLIDNNGVANISGGDFKACWGRYSIDNAGTLYLSGTANIDLIEVYKPDRIFARNKDGSSSYTGTPVEVRVSDAFGKGTAVANVNDKTKFVIASATGRKLLTSFSDESWTAELAKYHGDLEQNARWDLFENGDLYLSGEGYIKDYENEERIKPWDKYYDINPVKLIVEEGISRIGSYAFYYNSYLEDIVIRSEDLSIGDHAFGFCDSITSIDFGEGNIYPDVACFGDLDALETVHIPVNVIMNGGYYGAGTGYQLFYHCDKLKSAVVDCAYIGPFVFESDYALRRVTFTNPDVDFYWLANESGNPFNSNNGSTVTPVIVGCECSRAYSMYLEKNRIGLFDPSFEKIAGDTTVHDYSSDPVYTWGTKNSSAKAELKCKNDSTHVISELGKISTAVKPASCTEPEETTYTAVFTNSLFNTQTKTVETGAPSHIYTAENAVWSWNGFDGAVATVSCVNKDSTVEKDASITSAVTVTPTLTTSGVKTYVATVTIDGAELTDTKHEIIPSLGGDLAVDVKCGENSTVTIRNDGVLVLNGSGVVDNLMISEISGAAALIDSIVIDDEISFVNKEAFADLKGVKEITLPITVDYESGVFVDLTGLEKVTLTSGSGAIKTYNASNYQDTPWFVSETATLDIVIADGVKELSPYTFCDCDNLSSIRLSEDLISIPAHLFDGCSALKEIYIPAGVRTIESSAFANCSSLKVIMIPSSVETIDSTAFAGCSSNLLIMTDANERPAGIPASLDVLCGITTETYQKIVNGDKFAITYLLNGGENASNNPDSFLFGEEVVLSQPKRNGYEFIGWSTAEGTVTVLDTAKGHDIIVTANWTPINYTIAYDLSGGTADNPANYTIESETITLSQPVRSGYSFKNWKEGNGIIPRGSTGDKHYTAEWIATAYPITYILDDGSLNNPKTVYTIEEAYVFPTPERYGYTFDGWYTDAAFTRKVDGIEMGTMGAITVCAKWNATIYPITYELNGGELSAAKNSYTTEESYTLPLPVKTGYTFGGWYAGASKITKIDRGSSGAKIFSAEWIANQYLVELGDDTMTFTYGEPYGQLPSVSKEGYVFTGWFLDGEMITSETIVKTAADHCLTASFDPITYTLRFNNTELADIYVDYDESVVLPVVTKTGFTFLNWSTAEGTSYSGTVRNLSNKNGTIIELYPVYSENAHLITYHLAEKAVNPNPSAFSELNAIELKDATLVGHTFKGWYLDGRKITVIPAGTTRDIELYGEFEADHYTVSFDDCCDSMTVTYGDNYGELPVPQRTGYTFAGWYLDGVKVEADTLVTKTSDHELKASFVANTYKIRFDCLDSEIAVVYGQPITGLPEPSKESARFAGWSVGGVKIADNTVYVFDSDITLTSEWITLFNVRWISNDLAIKETVVEDGTKVTMPEMSDELFVGWFVDDLAVDSEYVVISDVTFTAHYLQRFTVGFYVNDSLFKETSVLEGEKAAAFDLDVEGFKGWMLNGELYDFELPVLNDLVLVANIISYGDCGQVSANYASGSELEEGTLITLSSPDEGATIYYSVNDSEFREYDDSIVMHENCVIRAYASMPEYHDSKISEFVYKLYVDYGDVLSDDVPFIEEGIWVRGIDDHVFTGKAITYPEMRVYDGLRRLREKTDYTISYKNNTKAGTATVTVKGTGNYTGTRTISFTIIPRDITEAVSSDLNALYTGSAIRLKPVLMIGNLKLKEKTDYTVVYPDEEYITAGSHRIIITGMGNYAGEMILEQFIGYRTPVSKLSISVSSCAFGQLPNVVIKAGKTVLDNSYFDFEYQNTENVGTATLVVKAKDDSNYIGSTIKTYKITGTSLSKAVVTGIMTNYAYTGEDIKVSPTVNLNGIVLRENEDYYLSFNNNLKAGKATVVITGAGGYTGTIKKTYAIVAKDLSLLNITYDKSVPFSKSGAKPEIVIKDNGKVLIEKIDYTLTYSNNKALGTGTFTIAGKGNYAGKIANTYQIEPCDVANLNISVADKVIATKTGFWKSAPSVIGLDGKKLGTSDYSVLSYKYDGTDVTVETGDVPVAGTTIVVEIAGKGNYTGSATATYRIVNALVDKAKITLGSQVFTGNKIYPSKSQIVVNIGGVIIKNSDYDIVAFENNVNKGTAKLTIVGKGSYGGTKTQTFKINPKDLNSMIIFNANGGTGTMKSVSVEAGASLNLPGNIYKRVGYTFVGWNTREDGSGTHYDDRNAFTASLAKGITTVLYATWEKDVYTITYHPDGGTMNSYFDKYSVDSDPLILPTPTQPGYTFAGWFKTPTYKNKMTVIKTGSVGDMELYAKWTINK